MLAQCLLDNLGPRGKATRTLASDRLGKLPGIPKTLGFLARFVQCRITVLGTALTLRKNGVIEDTGMSSAVMGNPINAVAWLANKLHVFGVPLEAGHLVLSGSFIKAIRFGPGDVVSAEFAPLGTVGFSVERQSMGGK